MGPVIVDHVFGRADRSAGVRPRRVVTAARVLCALCASLSLGCGRTSTDAETGGGSSSTAGMGGSSSNNAIAGETSSTAAGGASAGVAGSGGLNGRDPQGCGALIDDMEDGSARICTGAGRVGAWYAFNDEHVPNTQWPAPTSPGVPIETSLIPGSRGASQRAMHTYGNGLGWGAGIGLDLNYDGTTYRVYDASAYFGVHFWARSSVGGKTLRFRISTASTTAVKYGGTCESGAPMECIGPDPVTLPLEPEWREYTVTFAELGRANERDRLTNIQFMAMSDFDFWVDDLSFLESEPNCCPNLPTCQNGVRFADAAVQRSIPKAAALSCAQVCALRNMSLSDSAMQSLGGFECLSALDTLSLTATQIVDLTPLAGLVGLHELSLIHGKLSDIQPLSALRDLRVLDLDSNQITEVRSLAAMVKLQSLNLTDNSIVDIAPIANFTALEWLLLSGNQIQDASPVSELSALRQLTLYKNRISNLGQALHLPLLQDLDLSDNQVSDVAALVTLSALARLSLTGNQIKDASPLAKLTMLNSLRLDSNQVETPLGAFSGLAELWQLDLSHNQVKSLGTVFGLPKLSSLGLGDNQLTDVSELASLSSLLNLGLDHNQISDPHALAALTQLETLNLANNSVRTLSGSFAFSKLHLLDLSNNGLSLIPEAALNGSVMTTVRLAHNQLPELDAFARVSFADWITTNSGRNAGGTRDVALLDLSDNQVTDLAPLLRATLRDAGIIASGNPLDCTAQAGTLQALHARNDSVDVCN